MLKLLCSPTCNYIINLTVSELFILSILFTNLAQDQILILILKCTCILKKLTLQPSFPVYLPFLFSADLSNQLILSKDATETEEGLKIRIFWYSIYLYTLIVTFGQGFPRDMIEPQWEKHDAAPLRSFQGLHRSSLHGGPLSLARQGSVSLAIDVIFKVMWKLSTNFLLPKKNTIKWWVLDVMTVDCLFLCFIVHSKRK